MCKVYVAHTQSLTPTWNRKQIMESELLFLYFEKCEKSHTCFEQAIGPNCDVKVTL